MNEGHGKSTVLCGVHQQCRVQGALEVGKLYPVVPDAEVALHGYIRVIDESGEAYGYAADRFFSLEVPQALADALHDAE